MFSSGGEKKNPKNIERVPRVENFLMSEAQRMTQTS